MPTTIAAQLSKLVELEHFINAGSNQNTRKIRINKEISDRKQQEPTPRYSEIKLRWLYLRLKEQEQSDKELIEQNQYLQAYTDLTFNIETLVEEKENVFMDTALLKKLIKEQKQIIFNNCLMKATDSYLSGYESDTSKAFSANDILEKAIKDFKLTLYREELMQYETTRLIERYGLLTRKKAVEKKNMQTGLMTINFEITPEMNFIELRIKNNGNLSGFKLEGTSSLCYGLGDLDVLTKSSLSKSLSDFFEDKGEDIIDKRVTDQALTIEGQNHIKIRSINQYFDNSATVLQHMSRAIDEVEELLQEIKLPAPESITIETQDDTLKALRETVQAYQKYLGKIIDNEKNTYQEREESALKKRENALNALSTVLNHVDILTLETRLLARDLVNEIKNNEPKWEELSFIDKILDFITLGIHALYRLGTFKELKQETDLYEAVKEVPPGKK